MWESVLSNWHGKRAVTEVILIMILSISTHLQINPTALTFFLKSHNNNKKKIQS